MAEVLTVDILTQRGFILVGQWQVDAANLLALSGAPPNVPGVYAFVMEGVAQYVGVASVSLAKRLYFYRKPGPTQATNIRLNAILCEAIVGGQNVEVYVATPPSLEWNGWTISGAEGLEAGIIKAYLLAWNRKGALPSITAATSASHPEVGVPSQVGLRSRGAMTGGGKAAGKYTRLCEFLRASAQNQVSLTFARIEQLVGPLPKSASMHRAWWANHEGNAQAKGWLPARYFAEVDIAHRAVVFRRFSR